MIFPPSRVRFAEPSDEAALWDLLMALNDDNNSFGFDVSETRIREHIRLGTERKGGAHGVIDGDGCLAASIGIIPDRWWFSDNWSLAQIWLFVRKEYRHLNYAEDLQEWGKWFRSSLEEQYGYPVTLISCVISHNRLPAKLKFWGRYCGQMIGGIFEVR